MMSETIHRIQTTFLTVALVLVSYFLFSARSDLAEVESKLSTLESRPVLALKQQWVPSGPVAPKSLYVSQYCSTGSSQTIFMASCTHDWSPSKYLAAETKGTKDQLYSVAVLEESCRKCGVKRKVN